MSRAVNEKAKEAHSLYKKGMSLADIAKKLDLPAGTVRRWKSANKWDSDCSVNNERSLKNSERSESVIEQLDKSNLNDKQKLFCAYYIKCFNATKAYQKAYGCATSTAGANGFELLKKAEIRDEIARLKQYKLSQALLAPEDIFQKYMDIAFADVTDYVNIGQETRQVIGIYGPLTYKDENNEKKPVMETVNVVNWKGGELDGTIVTEVKLGRNGDANIKLADRMKALQWLTDHMDMATEEQRARIAVLNAKAQDTTGGAEEVQIIDDV